MLDIVKTACLVKYCRLHPTPTEWDGYIFYFHLNCDSQSFTFAILRRFPVIFLKVLVIHHHNECKHGRKFDDSVNFYG